jgi:hypothetical protein
MGELNWNDVIPLVDPVEFATKHLRMVLSEQHKACLLAITSQDPADSQIVIKTPRGGGKTLLVAAGFGFLHRADPTWKLLVHSGSFKEAQELYSYYKPLVTNSEIFPQDWLKNEPTQGLTEFRQGGYMKILAASEKQSRGPHPDAIAIDEAVLVKGDLIDAVWPSVNASPRPKRLVFSTASNTMGAVSLDWFLNLWQNAERVAFKRFGWSRADCPWLNQDDAKKVMLLYGVDSETFKIEFEGEIGRLTGAVWDGKLTDEALVPFDEKGELPVNKDDWPLPLGPPLTEWAIGLDWGFTHPTVITAWEKQGETVFLRDLRIRRQESFTEIRQEIRTDYPKVFVYADSSSPGENEDLRRMGATVVPVIFSEDKQELINHVRWRLENKFMKIPKTTAFEPLIRQMKAYHYDEGSPPKPVKKDDDCVDSMLCGMKPFMRRGLITMVGAKRNW